MARKSGWFLLVLILAVCCTAQDSNSLDDEETQNKLKDLDTENDLTPE